MKKRDAEMLALGAAIVAAPAPRTEYVTRTIHNHRAPTDDSIRLAKEYEEKAWKAVEDRIMQDVKGFNAEFVIVERRCDRNNSVLMFKVNGKPFTIEIEPRELRNSREIFRKVAESIAGEIMQHLIVSQGAQPLIGAMR